MNAPNVAAAVGSSVDRCPEVRADWRLLRAQIIDAKTMPVVMQSPVVSHGLGFDCRCGSVGIGSGLVMPGGPVGSGVTGVWVGIGLQSPAYHATLVNYAARSSVLYVKGSINECHRQDPRVAPGCSKCLMLFLGKHSEVGVLEVW